MRVGIPVADLAAGLLPRHRHPRGAARARAHRRGPLGADVAARVDDRHDGLPGGALDGRRRGAGAGGQPPPDAACPMGCFRSADGYVNIAGPSGRLLRAVLRGDRAARPARRSALRHAAASARPTGPSSTSSSPSGCATRTTAEWVDALNAAGVPCGPVNTMDEVFADPQVRHLEMCRPSGQARLCGLPNRYPVQYIRRCSPLGPRDGA